MHMDTLLSAAKLLTYLGFFYFCCNFLGSCETPQSLEIIIENLFASKHQPRWPTSNQRRQLMFHEQLNIASKSPGKRGQHLLWTHVSQFYHTVSTVSSSTMFLLHGRKIFPRGKKWETLGKHVSAANVSVNMFPRFAGLNGQACL